METHTQWIHPTWQLAYFLTHASVDKETAHNILTQAIFRVRPHRVH